MKKVLIGLLIFIAVSSQINLAFAGCGDSSDRELLLAQFPGYVAPTTTTTTTTTASPTPKPCGGSIVPNGCDGTCPSGSMCEATSSSYFNYYMEPSCQCCTNPPTIAGCSCKTATGEAGTWCPDPTGGNGGCCPIALGGCSSTKPGCNKGQEGCNSTLPLSTGETCASRAVCFSGECEPSGFTAPGLQPCKCPSTGVCDSTTNPSDMTPCSARLSPCGGLCTGTPPDKCACPTPTPIPIADTCSGQSTLYICENNPNLTCPSPAMCISGLVPPGSGPSCQCCPDSSNPRCPKN